MRKINTKIKRKIRNRKKLKMVSQNKLRVSVYKSLKNISAQIIDDNLKKTIVSASSVEKALKKDKIKKIDSVYFDRGAYKYHGRIKALADSLRKNGLKF